MTFTEAVRSCLTQYATFSGRARRSEYWWFYLATIIATLFGALVVALLGATLSAVLPDSASDAVGLTAALVLVVGILALTIPSLAATVRRLHDTGRSGWWFLIALVPFGGIVLFVFTLLDSAPDNEYGPSLKGYNRHPGGGYPGRPYTGGQPAYGQQSQYGQQPEFGSDQPAPERPGPDQHPPHRPDQNL
jgi:uncharacterized membrane protein YhaH (DUF805 family)